MKGYFSEKTLNNYSRLAAEKLDADFAEGDSYDFTRCIRPDGSSYGTSGKCRKGTEGGPAEKKETAQRKPKEAAAAKKSTSGGARDGHAARVTKLKAEHDKLLAAHKAAKEELKAHRGRDLRARVKRHQLANAAQTLEDKKDEAFQKLLKAKRTQFAAEKAASTGKK
jgi:hypothetical protein